ncbi:hypothetical protein F8M41_019739 [Gigaspora margarita]|uniref:Uncharacterized protein n=1 Tax=Gigaspora margarita TaxID=4874 RepID=A0A8H4ETZ6_GIGMA|nr:hypothetical protein F8M41_019739 [Gigaspora margarita]
MSYNSWQISSYYEQYISTKINYDNGSKAQVNSNTHTREQELEDQVNELKKKNIEMQLKIDELECQVKRSTSEAARYQSTLGKAIKDNDLTNFDQLRRDIDALKQNLQKFCMVKPADDFEINFNAAIKLLEERYECIKIHRGENGNATKINNVSDNEHLKTLIQAALQRFIIESVIRQVKYLEYLGSLEINVINQTDDLLRVLKILINSREGNDDISRIMPIRLRQQIYSILDNRGFNPVKIKNTTTEHPFINTVQNEIMKVINDIRTVKNEDKLKSLNDMAADLIRDIIKIFFFRLKVQEQVATLQWFKFNNPVDLSSMDGSFGYDDCQNMVVQICAFPFITVTVKDKKHAVARANVHVITKKELELGAGVNVKYLPDSITLYTCP